MWRALRGRGDRWCWGRFVLGRFRPEFNDSHLTYRHSSWKVRSPSKSLEQASQREENASGDDCCVDGMARKHDANLLPKVPTCYPKAVFL